MYVKFITGNIDFLLSVLLRKFSIKIFLNKTFNNTRYVKVKSTLGKRDCLITF